MDNELAQIYKNIVGKIIEKKGKGRVLNRYDYYVMGGIPIKRAMSVIYDLFRKKQITLYEFEVLRGYLGQQMSLNVSYNKEFILSTYYQFGDIVISAEEKKNIWQEMHKLGLGDKDIDDVTFSGAVRAYAIREGLIKPSYYQNDKRRLLKKK